MKRPLYFFLHLLLICQITHLESAPLSSKLQSYFEKSGGSSNSTRGGVFHDQSAGYYSGGSFVGRIPVANIQPFNVQLPGFKIGCGGIDAWFGGFSHISSDQLVAAMRQIGSSIGSYAFMLAMESISPEIYNVVNELQAIAQKINDLNINTCEAAATTLGGILPQSDATSKHLCQAMGSNYGGLSDWTNARHNCGPGSQRKSHIRDQRHQELQDVFKDEFNVVWQALRKNSFLSNDKGLAEIFMTISGTLIVKEIGDNYQTLHIRSAALDQDFLNSMLHGGNTKIQKCDTEDKCLSPILSESGAHQIVPNDALVNVVSRTLKTLVNKIYNDDPLSDQEKSFLNNTTLPIYKFLNVLTAYKRGKAPIEIESYAEIIALDIVHHFVLGILDLVEESVSQLRSAQMSDTAIREYLQNLYQVRSAVVQARGAAMEHMNSVLSMIKSVQQVEKQLHVYLGTVSDNNWEE